MIETIVDSIRVNLQDQTRIVFLKEINGDRHLPIFIGEFEASAIAMELQGLHSPRPLPYDLLKTIISDLSGTVERVVVSNLTDDVFFARIILDVAGNVLEIDSRASDAIALAVRARCPILVDDNVMDQAGIGIDLDDDDSLDEAETPVLLGEDQLSVFRDFIDTLDLDDFEKRRGN